VCHVLAVKETGFDIMTLRCPTRRKRQPEVLSDWRVSFRSNELMLGLIGGMGGFLALGCVVAVAGFFWEQLASEAEMSFPAVRFRDWCLKGLAVPLVFMGVFNTGWIPGIPPVLVPLGGVEPGTLPWVAALPGRLEGSVAVLASWWGAVTLAWLLPGLVARVCEHEDFKSRRLLWLSVTVPLGGAFLLSGGGWTAGYALMIPLGGLLYGLLPLREVRRIQPVYSRAVGHTKMGRYAEAEAAVLAELESCPDDYEGWMLLAELYAEHFGDLSLAEQTVVELCDQPGLSGIQISLALQRLADWHLKLGEDPVGAHRAMQGIVDRLPGSHFAGTAVRRQAQLPISRDDLRDRRHARSIPLPALADPLDRREEGESDEEGEVEAVVARANLLTARLEHDPNDPEPREELARLLADRLGRVEQAIEQVRLLLAMENTPEDRVPEWLALLAAWHLKQGQPRDRARGYLETLVRDYPGTPQAMVARRRLNVMDLARKSPLRS
jgi:tetratricopeptide (TPR) repeat protein